MSLIILKINQSNNGSSFEKIKGSTVLTPKSKSLIYYFSSSVNSKSQILKFSFNLSTLKVLGIVATPIETR